MEETEKVVTLSLVDGTPIKGTYDENGEYVPPKADPEEYRKGTDKKTGRFIKGNTLGKGRPKGSRNKLNQDMLNRVAARSEDGLSPEEIIMNIMQDAGMSPDLRFKAAAKIMDMVHPKAQSIELTVDEKDNMSKEQMEDRIKQLMAKHARKDYAETKD